MNLSKNQELEKEQQNKVKHKKKLQKMANLLAASLGKKKQGSSCTLVTI